MPVLVFWTEFVCKSQGRSGMVFKVCCLVGPAIGSLGSLGSNKITLSIYLCAVKVHIAVKATSNDEELKIFITTSTDFK